MTLTAMIHKIAKTLRIESPADARAADAWRRSRDAELAALRTVHWASHVIR